MNLHDCLISLVGRANATIIEVGANNGADTLRMVEAFPFSQIFAFEPDPRAARRFRERVLSPRVRLMEMAVGASNGHATFYQSGGAWPGEEAVRLSEDLPEDWDLSGSIKCPKRHLEVHPWVKFDTTTTVPIVRLDTWCADYGIKFVDLIWADIQGAEGDFITGAFETLKRTRYFYTEYSNVEMYEDEIDLSEILNLLPEFKIVKLFDNDVLLKNTNVINFNELF